MDVEQALREAGGVLRRSALPRTRGQHRQLAELLTSGAVRAVGGWVTSADASPALVAARCLNATITCVSAAAVLGLPVLRPDDRVHVAVPRDRARVVPDRGLGAVVVHRESLWTPAHKLLHPVAPVPEALARALRCLPAEEAICLVDGALHRQLVSREELERALLGRGAGPARRALGRADGRSRSLAETCARLVLQDAGFDVIPGVVISGVGEVDLRIGHVVLECDGFAYHSGRREFREDRRRDRVLTEMGYVVLRFTWEDIMGDPSLLIESVRAALAVRRVVPSA